MARVRATFGLQSWNVVVEFNTERSKQYVYTYICDALNVALFVIPNQTYGIQKKLNV